MRKQRKNPSGPMTIDSVLSTHPLARLACAKAQTAALLAQHLHASIPLTRHCTGFSTDAERLEVVLHLNSSAWAQRLLMDKPLIINELTKIPGFEQVCRLRFRIDPRTPADAAPPHTPNHRPHKRSPPVAAAAALRKTAETVREDALRRALLRLAERAEGKDHGGEDH